ncbi:phosphate ABC transporter substrate-binding protein PstS [Deinococcus misasensis]|uniref:phosphate ABC transporter substrate-binding protein PstS n=1 Tax=Deinococcus misasensis TaxID=392413 RepID=UPI00054F58C0|nr:phosphate ABC transporter substrate-binding protein PstS [Deinococcus misasensis]
MKKVMLTAILMTSPLAFAVSLQGAGASFPYPLYLKYFAEYKKATGTEVSYQSIGSGGGQRQILEQTVDFGASDGPMSDSDMAKAPNGNKILHIPTALGAVVPIYNIPGVDSSLKFDGKVLADIFSGKITKWNDAALVKENPELKNVALPITIARRADGSGTTFIFTDYLSKVSKTFSGTVGKGTTVNWPQTSIGGKGNDGVTSVVKQTPGSIGYVELIFAKQNNIDYGQIKNKSGKYVKATLKGVTSAAASKPLPADTRVSITDAAGADSYPISGYTWILVYQNQDYGKQTNEKAKAVKDLLKWIVTDGQKFNEDLGYAQLPDRAQKLALGLVNSIKFGNSKL